MNAVIEIVSDKLTAQQAILVVQARLLGATHRRLSELFLGNSRQQAGAQLLAVAEKLLTMKEGSCDDDEFVDNAKTLLDELGYVEGTF